MPAHEDRTSSRLVARLREISRGSAAPLGFGRAPTKKQPALLLVIYGTPSEAALLGAAAGAGADVIVGRLDAAQADVAQGIAALESAAAGRPLGIEVMGALDADQLRAVTGKGVDFVAFEPHLAAVDVLDVPELGRLARLILDHQGSILRGLNDLPVDAIEVELDRPKGSASRLTVHDVADLRQVIDAIRRPVVFIAPAGFRPADLKPLRAMGVEALALDAGGLGESSEIVTQRVGELRSAIDALGPPIGRGRLHEGRQVFLPAAHAEEGGDGEDDDDADDD